MADGKIIVQFVNGGGSSGVQPQEETAQTSSGAIGSSNDTQSGIARSAIVSAGISVSKQAILKSISYIGDVTGDYLLQNKLDNVAEATSLGVMLTHFPIGTIAGAFSIATKSISKGLSQYKNNKDVALLQERAGNETMKGDNER